MKVYCGNCKHFMKGEAGVKDECRGNPAFSDLFYGRVPVYSLARDKNLANSCPAWQPNRRYRLRRWLERMWGRWQSIW